MKGHFKAFNISKQCSVHIRRILLLSLLQILMAISSAFQEISSRCSLEIMFLPFLKQS